MQLKKSTTTLLILKLYQLAHKLKVNYQVALILLYFNWVR